MVSGLTNLLNPPSEISAQYEKGMMGSALGFQWKMDQNVNRITMGTRVATSDVTVTTTSVSGATTLAVTKTTGHTFKAGDTFYITTSGNADRTYSVNPETKQSTGINQQFVVTADASGAGTTDTLYISPAIITSGPYQTVTALPTATDKLVFYVAASGVQENNICCHKDAFTLVTADLVLPTGVEMAAREMFDGVSLRMVKQYEIINDRLLCRFDVLYGVKELYPQWACKVIGDSSTLV
jgi:hypothetical protein